MVQFRAFHRRLEFIASGRCDRIGLGYCCSPFMARPRAAVAVAGVLPSLHELHDADPQDLRQAPNTGERRIVQAALQPREILTGHPKLRGQRRLTPALPLPLPLETLGEHHAESVTHEVM